MAKSEHMEKETWGTWEELLLACAVNRHGSDRWSSVAMEIQNRCPSPRLLTPQNCEQKYHDLKRRFMAKDDKNNEGEEESEQDVKTDTILWLDELRKLRVAELRREVQRYDVSIMSLQLKVKRLTEEREQGSKENGNVERKPDLRKDSEKKRHKDHANGLDKEMKKSSLENVAGKHGSGEESDRENQSYSTDPKDEILAIEKRENNCGPVCTGPSKLEPVSGYSEPVWEVSYNGSSDSMIKDSAILQKDKSSRGIPASEVGDSPELRESVAESKGGGEEGTKENSDVQSSASLSKKNRQEKPISGSNSGDEAGNDEILPANIQISVKPQPLINFLAIIQSHKYGYMFERRLESQESTNYRSLIRRHVDLESVRMKLEEGKYVNSDHKFFRDLLLLFNNALVFFPKYSPEFIAGIELRDIVTKEMANTNWNSALQSKEESPPPLIPSRPKPDSEPLDSLLVKPKSSRSMFACRKRSSISAKASSIPIERKPEQKAPVFNEKPVLDPKKFDNFSADNVKEQSITKKKRKDRSGSGVKSSRTPLKSRMNTNSIENITQKPNPNLISSSENKGENSNEKSEPRREKKNDVIDVAKKRSAANFLNRMKRNSSSNGILLETLKSSVNNSISNRKEGGVEQKKSDGRKDEVGRSESRRKQKKVQSNPAKKSVGRPPKKTVEPTLTPSPSRGKRTRESVVTERIGLRQARKRTRR